MSRNSTILTCSVFHFKAFPLTILQNLFLTWIICKNSSKLLHTAVPVNRKVFHYITAKHYNLGLLQHTKTERKFIIKSTAYHMNRAGE